MTFGDAVRKRLALISWVLASLAWVPRVGAVVRPVSEVPPRPAYVPGEIIVKFKASLVECAHCLLARHRAFASALTDHSGSLDDLNRKNGVRGGRSVFRDRGNSTTAAARAAQIRVRQEVRRRFVQRAARAPGNRTQPDLTNISVLYVPEDADVEAVSRAYAADPHVVYAQPNYRIQAMAIPNDPYLSSSNSWGQGYDDLWALKRIKVPEAWDRTQGQGITVAVVDTGVDYTHPDIAANIVPGWNFIADNADPMDDFGHGTHVAGTIAAVGNNSLGIIGVAPQAKIMPVKGLDNTGSGSSDGLAAAIVYAATHGADVINNSWGCGSCISDPVLEDAVREAYSLGSVSVFAAGNNFLNIVNLSPQNMIDSKPIVAAASSDLDAAAYFSNYGILIDVAAPGTGDSSEPGGIQNILSLRSSKCDPELCDSASLVGDRYLRLAGTSMAASLVSGAAALVLSLHPGFTNDEVRQVLRASADPMDGEGLFRGGTGKGRLNVARALEIDSVPEASILAPSLFASYDPGGAHTLDIRGTAAGPGFLYYQLFYSFNVADARARLGPPPDSWVPIGPAIAAPVNDGQLGALHLDGLPVGLYTVRLVCLGANGAQSDAFGQFAIEYGLRRVSVPPAFDMSPAVSGRKIVWTHTDNDPAERFFCLVCLTPHYYGDIFLYDAATDTRRAIKNTGQAAFPSISGDRIVWVDYRSRPCAVLCPSGDIYMYDLKSNTESLIAPGPAGKPVISGDKVVWLQASSSDPDAVYSLYVRDLSSNTTRRITTADAVLVPVNDGFARHSGIAISGNRVAWIDRRNGPWEIFVHDLTTDEERRISPGLSPRGFLEMSLAGNRMVLTYTGDVLLYDMVSDETRRLNGQGVAFDAEISGDRVVWLDYRGDSFHANVYAYDLRTDTERQITSQILGQNLAAISGDTVVWMDDRDGSHIYMYEFRAGDGAPLPRTVPWR